MFEKDLSLSLLYDLYAPLLSEKKREAFEGYYLSDLSLSEIAAETGTSRQAVRDLIARTSSELVQLEESLGLLAKRKKLSALCDRLENRLGDLGEEGDKIRELL